MCIFLYMLPSHVFTLLLDLVSAGIIALHYTIQVMAIAHSMLELGCTKAVALEFVFRMCVVHQLTEYHKHQLVIHLVGSKEDGAF